MNLGPMDHCAFLLSKSIALPKLLFLLLRM
jgi:hypothetical protein